MGIKNNYTCLLVDSGDGWFSNKNSSPAYVAFDEPELSLEFDGSESKTISKNGVDVIDTLPLDLLDQYIEQGYTAVGYIGYDYSKFTMEGFEPISEKEGDIFPALNFLFYKQNKPKIKEFEEFANRMQVPVNKEEYKDNLPADGPVHMCSNMTKYEYTDMINKGKSYIQSGDIYQVNLSQRMVSRLRLEPFEYFSKFYLTQPVPYGCYLDFGRFQLLSGSMELFLEKRGNKLLTKPIKGTTKRGNTDEIDTILKAKLISSEKERAENLMIVDLMRNDLGRLSLPGSVKVNTLFELQTYSTLHQMVSEVESKVDENIKASQIVSSVFPPGSVTGAPKRRTLEVIDELEPHRRGPYCGAIGIFYPNGNFTLSVGIRIMLIQNGKATYFAGGGIVWDSDPQKEYEETVLKSKAVSRSMGIHI
ncbi:MAG: aminodeoxychorismate synthase component I [Thermodesulfobacteriota bacterium]